MRGHETKEGVPAVHFITSFLLSRLTLVYYHRQRQGLDEQSLRRDDHPPRQHAHDDAEDDQQVRAL